MNHSWGSLLISGSKVRNHARHQIFEFLCFIQKRGRWDFISSFLFHSGIRYQRV